LTKFHQSFAAIFEGKSKGLTRVLNLSLSAIESLRDDSVDEICIMQSRSRDKLNDLLRVKELFMNDDIRDDDGK